MAKSLLERIKAKPPAGPKIPKWWIKLAVENPKASKEIEDAADAFWRGDLRPQCRCLMELVRQMEEEGPKLGIEKSETGWKSFINSRKPKANG
jgi:hypothetical protein